MNSDDKKPRKPKLSCLDRAVAMLSRRGYSVGELKDKLLLKNYEEQEINEATQHLLERRYLDDARFAYERVRHRIHISGWGKKRIMGELYQKKVDSVTAEKAFLEYFETEADKSLAEQAYQILMKKYGPWQDGMEDEGASYDIRMAQRKEIDKDKNRRLGFLMRRGFSMNEAMSALDRSSRPDEDDIR